jgi:hypothetical protein
MNTIKIHRIRTAAFTTVVGLVAAAGPAVPAFAAPTHGEGEGGAGTVATSPYAQPIAALGGMTLAQYILKHQAGDPRTFTGV